MRAFLIAICGIAAGLGLAFIISISNPSKAPAETPSNTNTSDGTVSAPGKSSAPCTDCDFPAP